VAALGVGRAARACRDGRAEHRLVTAERSPRATADTEVLFSLAHVRPNLARYPAWLIGTETPFLLLALLAPAWIARHRGSRPARDGRAVVAALLIVHVSALHGLRRLVVYPVSAARAAGRIVFASRWRSTRRRARDDRGRRHLPRAGAVAAARRARSAGVRSAGAGVAVPATGGSRDAAAGRVVLSMQQSGSIRYHGGRPTLAWDAIAAGALDRTRSIGCARTATPVHGPRGARGGAVRAGFAGQRFGALDWPPIADIHGRVAGAGLRSFAR
jgi:hypothetical protein